MLAALLWLAVAIPSEWTVAIANYHDALAAAKRGGSIERLLDRATELKSLLSADDRFDEMSESDVAAMRSMLPGIILNNEEVILAEPDPKFFLELARKHGRRDDVAFFTEFDRTFPNEAGVPSYIAMTSDATGCTRFGSGEIVRRYAGWVAYRSKHEAYRKYADAHVAAIEEEVASTCACDGIDSVIRELSEFARRFPKSPASPAARKRLREIRGGKSPMRFQCTPG